MARWRRGDPTRGAPRVPSRRRRGRGPGTSPARSRRFERDGVGGGGGGKGGILLCRVGRRVAARGGDVPWKVLFQGAGQRERAAVHAGFRFRARAPARGVPPRVHGRRGGLERDRVGGGARAEVRGRGPAVSRTFAIRSLFREGKRRGPERRSRRRGCRGAHHRARVPRRREGRGAGRLLHGREGGAEGGGEPPGVRRRRRGHRRLRGDPRRRSAKHASRSRRRDGGGAREGWPRGVRGRVVPPGPVPRARVAPEVEGRRHREAPM